MKFFSRCCYFAKIIYARDYAFDIQSNACQLLKQSLEGYLSKTRDEIFQFMPHLKRRVDTARKWVENAWRLHEKKGKRSFLSTSAAGEISYLNPCCPSAYRRGLSISKILLNRWNEARRRKSDDEDRRKTSAWTIIRWRIE